LKKEKKKKEEKGKTLNPKPSSIYTVGTTGKQIARKKKTLFVKSLPRFRLERAEPIKSRRSRRSALLRRCQHSTTFFFLFFSCFSGCCRLLFSPVIRLVFAASARIQ